jgi:ribosomal protein L11 methyltransferase
MAYLALRFDTGAADADAWADALLDAGALSVDLADPGAGTADETPLFGEPGEPDAALWPISRLTALFAGDADADDAIARAGAALHVDVPPHETTPVADLDWVRATQAQFAPIPITDRLWIVPSWCKPVAPGAINLKLDPGLAFGTGSHPTTRLCLEWLATGHARGRSVLDYGCGSGILAIAAMLLGAARAVGMDVDAQALTASRANAAANGIAGDFITPGELARDAAFDVIVANILPNPLVLLAPSLAMRVHPRGRILLSGILAEQADMVAAAYARWFIIDVWREDGGWVALEGVRSDRKARN